MEMPYSPIRKPRDRKTKLHTKTDRIFSVYSNGLDNEVLTERFCEKQCDWYAKRGMNYHVSCAITSDGKGNFFRFLLQPPIQQLFTGVVLCAVHLEESPNHRSLLNSKGKEGLSKIR